MEWGTPVYWGWFLLFSRSGGHKTKETYPTRPGSPTPCKQALKSHFVWIQCIVQNYPKVGFFERRRQDVDDQAQRKQTLNKYGCVLY